LSEPEPHPDFKILEQERSLRNWLRQPPIYALFSNASARGALWASSSVITDICCLVVYRCVQGCRNHRMTFGLAFLAVFTVVWPKIFFVGSFWKCVYSLRLNCQRQQHFSKSCLLLCVFRLAALCGRRESEAVWVCDCACRIVETLQAKPLCVCVYLTCLWVLWLVTDHRADNGCVTKHTRYCSVLFMILLLSYATSLPVLLVSVCHLFMLLLYVFNKLHAKWCLHLGKLS